MATNTPPVSRRPHFRRHDPPAVLITDDDVIIIRHVAEHRFRRSTDIVRLMSHRPPKKIIERLGVLYHTAYLDRPRAQRDYFNIRQERPAYIYALGNRGAALLAEIDGHQAPKVDWTEKNRDLGRPYLHHQLAVADALIAFRMATQSRSDVEFIAPEAIVARSPEATQRLDNPWKWRAKVPVPGGLLTDLALVPDAVFGLDFTEQRKRVFFMLEADRATMPVWRSNLVQTSMYKKFLTYYHGHRAGHHTRAYDIGNFRVLTCTTSAERQMSMIDVIRNKVTDGKGSNLFLFTDAATLTSCPDVLSLPWTSGKGEPVRLGD